MSRVSVVLGLLFVAASAASLSTYLTSDDQERLKSIFDTAAPYSDASTAYYAIKGLSHLGTLPDNVQEACKKLRTFYELSQNDVEIIFYTASAADILKSCRLEVGGEHTALRQALADSSSVAGVYHSYFALKLLGFKVEGSDVVATLKAALKKDDSPLSHGYAFLIAADLTGEAQLVDLIDDIFAQADDNDEKYFQFEGGLQSTSIVLEGAYKLAQKAGQSPNLPADKVLKLASYLLSRKHVQRVRAASQLLAALSVLSTNPWHVPVVISLANDGLISEQKQQVVVRVSNLLGQPLSGSVSLTADSARSLADDAVVLSKKPLSPVAGSDGLYELDFSQAKAPFGFYVLSLSAAVQPADKRFIGTQGATLEVKLTTKVTLESIEIGVVDKDQTSGLKTTRLQYPKKAANIVEADSHQRVVVAFTLRSASVKDAFVKAHQVFVRLTNQKTKQEIIFVTAVDDANKQYKFDLDVGAKEKDFGSVSGRYSLDVLIGDAVIENPVEWTLAEVDLKFAGNAAESAHSAYSALPEIKHMFREPEKRPPTVVSNFFTLLVIAPLLLLFALWIKLGVNVNNFSFSLSAIGFHGGLAGIFALYLCYFLNLNMFQTLRYLALIAVPTFIFGHRLLNSIASKRKH